jgi:hypothetical protein
MYFGKLFSISSNKNPFTLKESVTNFMKLYVDFKPMSPKKGSKMSVENSPIASQEFKSSFNCL